jgi:hypothetical protein
MMGVSGGAGVLGLRSNTAMWTPLKIQISWQKTPAKLLVICWGDEFFTQ